MSKIDFSQVITAEDKAKAAFTKIVNDIRFSVDSYVEDVAKAKGYNSAAHCASYAKSTVPMWAAEAEAFIQWRDMVWLSVFGLMEVVSSGKEPLPNDPVDVIKRLPEIRWP